MYLDILPAVVVPGVSAPSTRDMGMDVIEPIIDRVVGSGRLRLVDVAELNPSLDIGSHTARAAARLVVRAADGIGLQGTTHG